MSLSSMNYFFSAKYKILFVFFFHNFRLIDFEMKFKFKINLIYFVWVHKVQPDTSFIDKKLKNELGKKLRKKIEIL